MNFIYVVQGDTGKYSDHSTWNVAAYELLADAVEHAQLANEYAKQSPDGLERYEYAKKNPYDPATGTYYRVLKIPFADNVEAFVAEAKS